MKALTGVIFSLFLILVNNQVPSGKSINSCGLKGYGTPTADQCKEEGEICCYIYLKKGTEEKKFCASSPSKITRQDIKKEIEEYTGYTLEQITCNNSKYIKNILVSLLLALFILFWSKININ